MTSVTDFISNVFELVSNHHEAIGDANEYYFNSRYALKHIDLFCALLQMLLSDPQIMSNDSKKIPIDIDLSGSNLSSKKKSNQSGCCVPSCCSCCNDNKPIPDFAKVKELRDNLVKGGKCTPIVYIIIKNLEVIQEVMIIYSKFKRVNSIGAWVNPCEVKKVYKQRSAGKKLEFCYSLIESLNQQLQTAIQAANYSVALHQLELSLNVTTVIQNQPAK
jgi:hypothetical protein